MFKDEINKLKESYQMNNKEKEDEIPGTVTFRDFCKENFFL